MSIINQKDSRSGIIYVYESESWWDKEKKQSRSKRRLIGRLDEKTGTTIPTDGRRRKSEEKPTSSENLKKTNKKQSISSNDYRLLYEKSVSEQIRMEKELEACRRRISELEAVIAQGGRQEYV